MEPAEFRQFFGILPEPMLLLSGAGVILAANPAADTLLRHAAEPGVADLHDVVDDPKERVDRLLIQWRRSRVLSPSTLSLRREAGGGQRFRADGALVRAAREVGAVKIVLRLVPKDTTTQRFLALNERIEALNKEVVERQRAEAALARTNEDLRCANADLEQFAYSASHDLREPLRMIAIYSDLLNRRLEGEIDAKTAEFLSYTMQGAKRMESLIHDLLAYTQAVSMMTDGAGPSAADSVLDVVLCNLRHAIDESQAEIEREPLPLLQVQQVHLLQIFQNLVGNALKYRSEAAPKISIRALREGPMWRIAVQDNGIGIDPQYADQVFGIFKRLHNSEQYSGTGIGLAICQKIVHRYGGRIWVHSDGPSHGSTFFFTLPAAKGTPESAGPGLNDAGIAVA